MHVEVPGWLHGVYPELYERERLSFYDLCVELAIYAHHPESDVREAAQIRIAELLSGRNHIEALIW
ncbi:hypothetical protein [Kineosporia babensis]|uniref:Uncharacterized protein n=1 Tax=Kineosporia babensis TaxID=499548 RepID=A0A9X1SU60_9ACTN|nr:hypothetical protein [Kineosporia babensis]MCD5312101.1 hypothetical protein [Kineosporia babensis]